MFRFSFKRVWSVFLIRNKEFYRDTGFMAWVFIFPIVVIFAFGYLFNPDEMGKPKMGLWKGVSLPKNISEFEIIYYDSKQEAIDKVKKQVIEIVVDFNQKPPKVWLATASPRAKLAEKLFKLSQYPEDDGLYDIQRFEGESIKYINWLIPGLISMNVMMMALWGVGWVIVRQRKFGVLKRFKASPLTAFEYLLGQMLSRMVVLIISGIIVFFSAKLIYPFTMKGSYFDLLAIYSLGCLSLSSIGLLIASRISSEELCNGIINFLTYPFIFLSEIWFTLEGAGDFIITLSYISPLWHMTDGMRKITNEGVSLSELSLSVLYLGGCSFLFLIAGSVLFKWNKE